MNGRRSKALRRRAMVVLTEWYKSLLDEEQQKEVTPQFAIHYTPVVRYWVEKHEMKDKDGKEYLSMQTHVSDYTQRWFIKQEKIKYGRSNKCSII